MTNEQQKARSAYARLRHAKPREWRIVQKPASDTWYDFYDLATGKHGQCRSNIDGKGWAQEPRGKNPTILAWRGKRKR